MFNMVNMVYNMTIYIKYVYNKSKLNSSKKYYNEKVKVESSHDVLKPLTHDILVVMLCKIAMYLSNERGTY